MFVLAGVVVRLLQLNYKSIKEVKSVFMRENQNLNILLVIEIIAIIALLFCIPETGCKLTVKPFSH